LELLKRGQTQWFGGAGNWFEFLRDEVAVGNIGFLTALSVFGAHDLTDALDLLLILALQELRAIPGAEGPGGVIAVFLQGLDFACEAALEFDELRVFLRVGEEFAHEVGPEEDSGEAGSGGLEADLGEFGGVMAPEELSEIVLEGAELEGVRLGGAPFLVAATGFPVRDVTFGDLKAAFLEGEDDSGVGQIVREHAVNHVAFEFGEVGDLAVAGFTSRTVLKRLERSGSELEGQERGLG
jgi:hypothetical protein